MWGWRHPGRRRWEQGRRGAPGGAWEPEPGFDVQSWWDAGVRQGQGGRGEARGPWRPYEAICGAELWIGACVWGQRLPCWLGK